MLWVLLWLQQPRVQNKGTTIQLCSLTQHTYTFLLHLLTSGPLAQQSEHCPQPSYRTCPSSKSDIQNSEYTHFVQLPSVSKFCYSAVLRIRNFSPDSCLLLAVCSSSPLRIALHSSLLPMSLNIASSRRLLEGREVIAGV